MCFQELEDTKAHTHTPRRQFDTPPLSQPDTCPLPRQPEAPTNSSSSTPESPLEGLEKEEGNSPQQHQVERIFSGLLPWTRDMDVHTRTSVTAQREGCHRRALTSQLNPRTPRHCTVIHHMHPTPKHTHTHTERERVFLHAKREVCISCRQLHKALLSNSETGHFANDGKQASGRA